MEGPGRSAPNPPSPRSAGQPRVTTPGVSLPLAAAWMLRELLGVGFPREHPCLQQPGETDAIPKPPLRERSRLGSGWEGLKISSHTSPAVGTPPSRPCRGSLPIPGSSEIGAGEMGTPWMRISVQAALAERTQQLA